MRTVTFIIWLTCWSFCIYLNIFAHLSYPDDPYSFFYYIRETTLGKTGTLTATSNQAVKNTSWISFLYLCGFSTRFFRVSFVPSLLSELRLQNYCHKWTLLITCLTPWSICFQVARSTCNWLLIPRTRMYLRIINAIRFTGDRREIVKRWGKLQQGGVQYCCDYFLYLCHFYPPLFLIFQFA